MGGGKRDSPLGAPAGADLGKNRRQTPAGGQVQTLFIGALYTPLFSVEGETFLVEIQQYLILAEMGSNVKGIVGAESVWQPLLLVCMKQAQISLRHAG